MDTPAEAKTIHGQQIINIPGVVFVGPKPDRLVVGVESQGKVSEVKPQVEGILGSVPFDVEYRASGGFMIQRRTAKERPIRPGSNTAPDGVQGYGTMGFLMTNGSEDFVISNNHVFAQNDSLSPGHAIMQPADPFQGGKSPPFKIGELESYVPISNGSNADLAWATVEVSASTQLIGIGRHEGPAIPLSPGDTIRKSGARTHVTTGEVDMVDVTVKSEDIHGNSRMIDGCVLTKSSMSGPGDSGSPVVKRDSRGRWRPAGIIFAGGINSSMSAITPATTIRNESGLEFVNTTENLLPDKASMCIPDGGGEMLYTLTVSGEIRGRDGELEPDDEISGSTVSGRLTGGFCDKFQFEGPILDLTWEGQTPNMWVNGSQVDLDSVSWSNPPASPDPTPDPPSPSDPSEAGGLGMLALGAIALASRRE